MKIKAIAVIIFLGMGLTSCDYQVNNSIKQPDHRKGDVYVYGVHPDSAAVQSKKKYTAKPELEQRTNAIREKMFGNNKKTNAGA